MLRNVVMAGKKDAPCIYNFLDVSQYLQAHFDWRKSQTPSFTYTKWAQELNIGSQTILRFILKRRRNITKKTAQVFCENLKLTDNDAQYFMHLVSYSQAKTANDRKIFGEALLKYQRSQYQQNTIPAWVGANNVYGPVILTLLTFTDTPKTIPGISHLLGITQDTTQEVLNELLQQGIVSQNNSGNFHYIHNTVKVPDSPGNDNLKRFYDYWMDKAKHSLWNDPVDTRKLRALKFALNEDEFKDIQQRLNEFAVSLLSRYHNDSIEGRRLYMLNSAIFPVTTLTASPTKSTETEVTR